MTQLIATVKQRTWKPNFPITKKEPTIKKSKRVDSIEHGKKNLSWFKKKTSINLSWWGKPIDIYIISSSKTVNHQPSIHPIIPLPTGPSAQTKRVSLQCSTPHFLLAPFFYKNGESTVSHWTINPFFSPRIGWKSHQFWKRHQICLQNPRHLSHNFIEIATWDLESKTIHVIKTHAPRRVSFHPLHRTPQCLWHEKTFRKTHDFGDRRSKCKNPALSQSLRLMACQSIKLNSSFGKT